jgi:DNA-binding response OmpR family regulator
MSVDTPGKKILVVDDVPQNVKLLRLILDNEGYKVIEASSGAQALERMKQEKPAAMILDVRMPGMSGYDVCRAVRSDPEFSTLPVIMVTALSLTEERVKGIEAGATDFITKPFNKKELLARLKSSLTAAPARGVALDIAEAVVITRPDWGVVTASKSAAESLQRNIENLIGMNLMELLALPNMPADVPVQVGNLSIRHTPVLNAQGEVVLRVITL